MDLTKLQLEHAKWCAHNFPNALPWEFLLGQQEELGELSHAFLKQSQGIRMNEPHKEKMVDAIGDLIIYLAGFCNAVQIDLADAVTATWFEVKQRDWVKYPERGVPNDTPGS